VAVNQQTGGGTWNCLGTYAFNAGTSGYVRIRSDGSGGYVVADAVRFYK
jgi:hyaluronate lyase